MLLTSDFSNVRSCYLLTKSLTMEDFYQQHGLDESTVVKEQLKQQIFQDVMQKLEAGKLTYMKRGTPEKVTNKKLALAIAFQYSDMHRQDNYMPRNQSSLSDFLKKKSQVLKIHGTLD